MSLLKISRIASREFQRSCTKPYEARLLQGKMAAVFVQSSHLNQRAVSLNRFSTQNDKDSFKPDGPATFFGTICGLGYIYGMNLLVNHLFDSKEKCK